MANTKFYLHNAGGDDDIAINWGDFWIFLNPMETEYNGAKINDPDFCEKYAELLHEDADSFYDIAHNYNTNSFICYCCYDPDEEYVGKSELIQLIAEIPDETTEEDVKSLKWYDADGQEVNF